MWAKGGGGCLKSGKSCGRTYWRALAILTWSYMWQHLSLKWSQISYWDPKAPRAFGSQSLWRGCPEVEAWRVIQDRIPSLTPDNAIVHQFKTSSAAGWWLYYHPSLRVLLWIEAVNNEDNFTQFRKSVGNLRCHPWYFLSHAGRGGRKTKYGRCKIRSGSRLKLQEIHQVWTMISR